MGNICRSPTAEGVFKHFIRTHRLEAQFEVDSAGTHGYHVGEAPDPRTQRAAASRGYDLSSIRARKVAPQDLDYFDIVLVMDRHNLDSLTNICAPEHRKKICLLMEYAEHFDDDEVPDPYYGLGHGFDLVIDMVEDASRGLIDELTQGRDVRSAKRGRRRDA